MNTLVQRMPGQDRTVALTVQNEAVSSPATGVIIQEIEEGDSDAMPDVVDDVRSIFNTNDLPLGQATELNMRVVMGERLVRYILRRASSGVRIAGREPISSARTLADKYLNNPRYKTTDEKVKAMILHESAKGFACGFGTSVGGIWSTLTVGASAGMVLSFVLQARLISAIAILYGQNVVSQPVETLVLLTMIGSTGLISRILRESAEVAATRFTTRALSRFVATSSAQTIMAINRRIGAQILSRVLPKTTAKTAMTSASSIVAPVVGNIAGGVLGGVIDAVSIRVHAKLACKIFRGARIEESLAPVCHTDDEEVMMVEGVSLAA